jgi:hypothetical protein
MGVENVFNKKTQIWKKSFHAFLLGNGLNKFNLKNVKVMIKTYKS